MNKQQCEEIISKFANKELSFGCIVKKPKEVLAGVICSFKGLDFKVKPSKGGGFPEDVYYDIMYNHIIHKEWIDDLEIIGHPVLIGDVLEAAPAHFLIDIDRQLPLLARLWGACIKDDDTMGFTRSLNDIMKNSGFEEIIINNSRIGKQNGKVEQLKCRNARELFNLLNDISK